MDHLKLFLLVAALAIFYVVNADKDKDSSESNSEDPSSGEPYPSDGHSYPFLHRESDNCAIFRLFQIPSLELYPTLPRGDKPKDYFQENKRKGKRYAYCLGPDRPVTGRAENSRTISCCHKLWKSKGYENCRFDETCSYPSYCNIPKDIKGFFAFEKCCQNNQNPADFQNGVTACYATRQPSDFTQKCQMEHEGYVQHCEGEKIPDVYPYCKSNGYGNNDATAHCCLKFKYVYNTTCIIDPLSAINTCAWSYNHIISGWVMHAAMATCCGSMNSQIDYVVGKPLDQMPRCPNV